jgi:hypothetical protein
MSVTDEPTTGGTGERSSPPRRVPVAETPSDALTSLSLTDDEQVVLAKVADILRKVRFGTVVVVVQDGKVVQIEMAEKFRLR